MSTTPRIQLVVLDWAGTAIDFGCFAPVEPFQRTLATLGVEVSVSEARQPMGLEKLAHLRAILALPSVAARVLAARAKPFSDEEVQAAFERSFVPAQMACVRDRSELISGLLPAVAWLRERKIKLATTTGYFPEAAELAYGAAAEQGYSPDVNVNGKDLPAGRPAPWMLFKCMQLTGVYPPVSVLKVGDTVPDILEGRNAGCWSTGVVHSSSEVACSEAEWNGLTASEQAQRSAACVKTLQTAGAHATIATIASLPELVEQINARLAQGERPA